MTPAEALRAAVAADDEAAVRDLLGNMSEAERVELIPVVRELVAAAVKRRASRPSATWDRCCLMAYGVLSVSEIRKLGWR